MSEPVPSERPDLRLVQGEDASPSVPDVEATDVAPADPGGSPPTEQEPDARATAAAAVDEGLPLEPPEVAEARGLLTEVEAAGFHRAMGKLARSSQSSILGPLPYSAAYEFHDPTVVAVEPEPAGAETVAVYCRAAYPDFDQVLLRAFSDPALDPVLTEIFHLLTSEESNVAIVTNHGQIIDIALVMGAFTVAMCDPSRTFGVLGESADPVAMAERNNVVVSRMVATRQALGLPAVQLLQSGTRVFFSVPQTHSRRRAKLEPEVVRATNTVMRHELDVQMSLGGQVLAMAASGSQDISAAAGMARKARAAWKQRRGEEAPESATLHLQPLYNGTINLMLGCRYVLPVAINLEPGTQACVVGSVTRVRTAEDCHRTMDWIADAHQRATGVPTLYHSHEDDLLTQVRGLLARDR